MTLFKVGDKVRVVDQQIIYELRNDYEMLRLLRDGTFQEFSICRKGPRQGQTTPITTCKESDYLCEFIEGFVTKVSWAAHPVGGMVWEKDKFQSLLVDLRGGGLHQLKAHWVKLIDDGQTPECVHCDKPTRRCVAPDQAHWQCEACADKNVTTWVSKPCRRCKCPSWDHGGASGCLGSPEQEERCDGCAGFVANEQGEDIICSQKRYDEIINIKAKTATAFMDARPGY